MRYPPFELDAWPDAERASRFVFITADLDDAFIAGLLEDSPWWQPPV